MAEFNVNFFEVVRLQAIVKDFFVTFIDSQKMHEGALQAFFKIEQKMFNSEGGVVKWQPLDSKYKAWKNKNYGGLPIMQLTGQLKNSLTGKDRSSLKTVVDGDTINVILLSNYWHNHQFGTTVPQRKTVDFTEADVDMIIKSMLDATIAGRLSRFFTKE